MKSKPKNKLVAFVKEAIRAAIAAVMGVAGAVLVVIDTLVRHHTHPHQHTYTHFHGGCGHTHTVTHIHGHDHFMADVSHTHRHSVAELERAVAPTPAIIAEGAVLV